MAEEQKSNLLKELNNLKKKVFYDLLNLAKRVFIVVKYSDNVIIGNRGFLEEEKKNGLILVFNTKMNFLWKDNFIDAKLVFGTTPQKCFIPEENIIAVYSPDIQTQFVTAFNPVGPDKAPLDEESDESLNSDKKVIKVDFSKKKQRTEDRGQRTDNRIINAEVKKLRGYEVQNFLFSYLLIFCPLSSVL